MNQDEARQELERRNMGGLERLKSLMRSVGCSHVFPKDGGALEGMMEIGGVRLNVCWFPQPFEVGDGFTVGAGWWVGDEYESVEETSGLLAQALLDAVQRRQRKRERLTAEMDVLRSMGGVLGYSETEVGWG